jgi:nitric oxide reductase subunit B
MVALREPQYIDVLNNGYWHVRGPEFLSQRIVRVIECCRLPGDLVFILFGGLPLVYAAGVTWNCSKSSPVH